MPPMPKRDTPKIAAPSSGSRLILNDCLTGELHPALGLVRLLDELGSVEAVADLIGTAVATGGFLCHYNPPYGDIFMNVFEPYRRQGFGSYMVQEAKRCSIVASSSPRLRRRSWLVA